MRERPPVRKRRRWILFGGACGVLVVVLLFGIPAIQNARLQGEMTHTLNDARQLAMAINTMNADELASGGHASGVFPADLKVRSFREYLDRLIENNYLSAADIQRMRPLEKFALVNVSSSDSKDTAFLVSRWMANPAVPHSMGFVVFQIGGSGGVYRRPADVTNSKVLKLPNRQPQILPQE